MAKEATTRRESEMAFRNYHGSDRSSTARSAMTGGGMAVKRLGRETGGQCECEPPNFTISATEGETASATISGTHPNWHIELVLPRGQDGTNGTNGYCECNCECCNGGGEEPPPCEDSGLHAGEEGWTYDGCHWSYTDPNPP